MVQIIYIVIQKYFLCGWLNMKKYKNKLTTVIVIITGCLLYNTLYFFKNGLWNYDYLIISVILILSSIFSSIIFK